MILEWMLRVAIASGLIAVGALLVERSVGYRGGSRRHVWVGGLLASVALPVLVRLIPDAVSEATFFRLDPGGRGADEVTRAVGAVVVGQGAAVSVDGIAIALWVGAAVLASALYGAGWWRLRRARRSWRPDRLGGRAVFVSAGVGPAAVGLLNPAIVVPEWLLWKDERIQRLVVLHESEHVEAGDHCLLALAPLAIVLAPWNPAFWFMVWRLRIAVEVDCDRRVLSRGVAAEDYGSLLIDVAGRTPAPGYGLALATRRTNLERRLLALTAANPRRAGLRALLNGSAAAALALVACAAAAPTPQRVNERLRLPPGLDGERVTYLIDGEPATEAAVRALAESSITHMEVTRQRRIEQRDGGESVEGSRIVRIHTTSAKHPPEVRADHPAVSIRRAVGEVRDRLRRARTDVWIDDRRSTFEAFDSLPADRVASLRVIERGPAARPEVRVTTHPSGLRPDEEPHQPQEER